jgi:hypothetical protein
VQFRQVLVKKFHPTGGDARNPERKTAAFDFEEIFIGNTEKRTCKIDAKGV